MESSTQEWWGEMEWLRTRSIYIGAEAVWVLVPAHPPTQFGKISASPFPSLASVSSLVKWT